MFRQKCLHFAVNLKLHEQALCKVREIENHANIKLSENEFYANFNTSKV